MMASMKDLVRAATGIQDVEFGVRLVAVRKQLLSKRRGRRMRRKDREGPGKEKEAAAGGAAAKQKDEVGGASLRSGGRAA